MTVAMATVKPPYFVFTDTDGEPLGSGYLYVGVANSNPQSNPVAVYWDRALTIPAVQPIRTVGGFPVRNGSVANIYVAASDYSLVVRNKKGELIFSSLSAVNDIVSNAASMTFLRNVAGAVPMSAQEKMEQRIDGREFDISSSASSSENAARLQAAFDATPPGGTLWLPNGEFDFNTGLVRNTPIVLIGDGIFGLGGCVLNYDGAGVGMTFQTSQNGLRLQNFRLAGTIAATDGIVIQDCFNGIMLDHIAVEGFTNPGANLGNCLKLDDTFDITAFGCQFRQSRNGVVGTLGATFAVVNTVKLYGCELTNNSNVGVQVASGVGWVIDGCDFSGIGDNGIGVDLAPSLAAGVNHQCKNMVIRGASYFEKASGAVNVQGVRIGHLATVGATSIASNTITGNYFDVSGDYIYVDYAQDTTIRDNHFGAVTAGKYKANLTGNANRTVLDIRPRSDINNGGTNTFYMTNDVQTLVEVDGNYTSPAKSAFSARPSGNINNVTGNGTVYTVVFGTTVFDVQSEFNPATGIFTAQKTGKYQLSCGITFNGAAGMTYCQLRLVTSNRTYDLFFGNAAASGTMCINGSVLADMDASDTAYVTIEVGGLGANTADIVQNNTFFTGALVG